MKKYLGLILATFLIVGINLACEKNYNPWEDDLVAFSEPLPDIPASYGNLKAVTSITQYPGWFQMWFEDDAGTIRIVRVQIFHNKMATDIKVIERTQPVVEEVTKDEG